MTPASQPSDRVPPRCTTARFPMARVAMARVAAALLAGLLLALPLALAPPEVGAQEDRPGSDRTFAEDTDVVEVQVPVTVVDRDGNPVRGLTREDFEISDEGEEQEITDFRIVDLSLLTPDQGRTRQMADSMPSAARRHFLFLFDLSFSDPISVYRARQAARDFVLSELHPTDLAAVAVFTLETGPQLLVTFTPDRAQLARAIDTLGARGLLADRGVNDPLRFIIEAPQALGADSSISGLVSSEQGRQNSVLDTSRPDTESAVLGHLRVLSKQFDRGQRSFERARITSWSTAMADLARALDSVRGRKQVIYFSEGFDSTLLMGRNPSAFDSEAQEDQLNIMLGQTHLVDSDQLYGNTRLQGDIENMLEQFRRSDAVIQAVDIGGLRAGADIRDQRGNSGQDSLFFVANETGGDLFKDANDLGSQLGRVLDTSEVTYLLSFQPKGLKHDGEYHRLKVDVDGHRSSRVSHRAGYYAPRPFEELHPLEKNLLASDAIASAVPRQEIDVSLLATPFKATSTSAYVPVILEMEGPSLLREHGDRPLLHTEIYAYVTDRKGQMRDFFNQVVTIDLAKARSVVEAGGVKYYGHLNLGPGDYLVRLLVRNADTGRTGVATTELTVPTFETDPQVILPPLFLEDPSRWVLAKEESDSTRGSVIYPFTVKGQPFIPSARPLLKAGDPARLCLVGYNLDDGEITLSARILGPDGTLIEGGRLSLEERTNTGIEGVDKLLATFNPRGLDPGDYTLEVEVLQGDQVAVNSTSIPFNVLD